MAHDRHDGDDVALTHEFLSIMLGTKRASVMEAIYALEDRGLIRATRGHVLIHDGRFRITTRSQPFGGNSPKTLRKLTC